MAELRGLGLCRPARFLPPWVTDPAWVLTHLTLTTFMAGVDLDAVSDAVADILTNTPQVDIEAGILFRAAHA